MRKTPSWFCLIPILVLAGGIYSWNITMPATRHSGSVLTIFGKQARNLLKFNSFTPLSVSGPFLENYKGLEAGHDYKNYYYVYHPFLPQWVIAVSYVSFGVSEWATRLPFFLFALACIPMFWLVAVRLVGERTASLATFFFAVCPMFAYNSIDSMEQVPTLFFLLAGVYFYLRWRENPQIRFLVGLFSAQFLACWSEWPGYYLALFVCIHVIVFEGRDWKIAGVLVGVIFFVLGFLFLSFLIPVAVLIFLFLWVHTIILESRFRTLLIGSVGLNFLCFGLFLLWLYLLDPEGGNTIERLLGQGGKRASSVPLGPFLMGEVREVASYFTIPLLLFSAIWAFSRIRIRRPHDLTLACFLVWGVDEIIFRNIAFHHDHYTYYLSVFLSLTAASAVVQMVQRINSPVLKRAILLLAILSFAGQAGWSLQNRFNQEGAWIYYRELGLAIDQETHPADKLLILVDDVPYYSPFYGDRFALRYITSQKKFKYEVMSPAFEDVPPSSFPEFVSQHVSKFDVIVAGWTDRAMENAFFRREGWTEQSDQLSRFTFLPSGGDLEDRLKKLSDRVTHRRGFSFYHLQKP